MLERPFWLLALASFAACSQRYEPDPKFSPASGDLEPAERMTSADRTARTLANTRCDQEALCDNIGAGRRYQSRPDCVASFERQARESLRLGDCTSAPGEDRLAACSDAIRLLSCASTPEEALRLEACAASRLCPR